MHFWPGGRSSSQLGHDGLYPYSHACGRKRKTCVWSKHPIYSTLELNLSRWYLTNHWLCSCSWGISLWNVIILGGSSQVTLFKFFLTRDATHKDKKNTNIRGDWQTENNEHYSSRTEMVRGPICEIICNLQLNKCTVWAAAKYESSTLCLVHSARYSPVLMHAGKIACSCYSALLAT